MHLRYIFRVKFSLKVSTRGLRKCKHHSKELAFSVMNNPLFFFFFQRNLCDLIFFAHLRD